MINLKITMVNNREYNIQNNFAQDIKSWIKNTFMPHGVSTDWAEIIPSHFIYVSNVLEIRLLTDEEIEKLNIVVDDEELVEGLDNSEDIIPATDLDNMAKDLDEPLAKED